MKKIKLVFITLALIIIGSGFVTSSSSASMIRKYRIIQIDGSRVYVEDISNLVEGDGYYCDAAFSTICTFESLLPPFYDPWEGSYYFNTSIVWLNCNVVEGEFFDLRY